MTRRPEPRHVTRRATLTDDQLRKLSRLVAERGVARTAEAIGVTKYIVEELVTAGAVTGKTRDKVAAALTRWDDEE